MFSKSSNLSNNPCISENLKALPSYLYPFIVEQNYERYTPRDHAVWRFIMRQARELFKSKAHSIYLDGLSKTGIPISRIPNIEQMNEILQKFSWGAVCVRGFIPPQIFLEYFAHRVLPIAADMRSIEHIAYTPAPDIVHEAAGHAPILADKAYADFLESFGKIASKAIYSNEDIQMYEAIRLLSDMKESPDSSEEAIKKAEENLKKTSASITWDSEASKLARMFWWTAEYGLVASKNGPQIYGAGLLSSLGESKTCLKDHVEKIPLSIACTQQTYDITRLQPQLFVADDFSQLKVVLKEFDESLSYKRGGQKALEIAIKAKAMTTTVFDNGFSVSGILTEFKSFNDGEAHVLQWKAPIQICCDGCAGEDKIKKDLEEFKVLYGKNLLDLPVDHKSFNKFFEGTVKSVYGGACDRENFNFSEQTVSESTPSRQKPFTIKERELFSFYIKVRTLRDDCEEKILDSKTLKFKLSALAEEFLKHYPSEWLVALELVEVSLQFSDASFIEEDYNMQRLKESLLKWENPDEKSFVLEGLSTASLHDQDALRQRL